MLAGVFNYVTLWAAIGHSVRKIRCFSISKLMKPEQHKPPLPSANNFKTATSFSKIQRLVAALQGLAIRLNKVLEIIDFEMHKMHQELREAMLKDLVDRILTTHDLLLWVGRSIIFNRATPYHTDKRDNPWDWTPLITLGTSKGGDLCLPRLKTKLFYEPGTVVFVRGGAVEHGVESFTGQRIAIAHFIHKEAWAKYGLIPKL